MFAAPRSRPTRDAAAALTFSGHEAIRAFEVKGRFSAGLNLAKARAAFKALQIEFTVEGGRGVGERLKKLRA